MFDRNSVAYRQLVADVADAVIARLADVANDAPASGSHDAATPPASPLGLTKREAAVLRELVAGGTSRSIALNLGISPRTVDVHRARVMRKLGVSGLVELVKVAIERMPPPAGQVEDPGTAAASPKVPDQ